MREAIINGLCFLLVGAIYVAYAACLIGMVVLLVRFAQFAWRITA